VVGALALFIDFALFIYFQDKKKEEEEEERALLFAIFDIVVLGSDFVPILDREGGASEGFIHFLSPLPRPSPSLSPQDQLGSRDSNPSLLARSPCLPASREERAALRSPSLPSLSIFYPPFSLHH
jgi:hypothetical protein